MKTGFAVSVMANVKLHIYVGCLESFFFLVNTNYFVRIYIHRLKAESLKGNRLWACLRIFREFIY